jgi:dCMP deaminase
LFEKYPHAKLYILGRDIISSSRPLEKDLRALSPELIKPAIEAWNLLEGGVEIATTDTLKTLIEAEVNLIMPDEDISHDLAAKYFSGTPVEYSPIFLRWDRRRSEAHESVGDYTVSAEQADQDLLQRANLESWNSSDIWRRVGALIVKDGRVLLHAYNRAQPTDGTSWAEGDPRNNFGKGVAIETSLFIHAEAALIVEAAREGVALKGASIYVTTFPCPNCAKLIVNAGIKQCYFATGYAMLDGKRLLEASRVDIIKVDVKLEDPPAEIWVPYPE